MRAVHVPAVSRCDVRRAARHHRQAVLGGGRGDALETGANSTGLQHLPQRLTLVQLRGRGHAQLHRHLRTAQTLDSGVVFV